MHLQMPGAGRKVILLEEDFRAPRDHLFTVWTDPEYLRKWFFAEDGWSVTDVEVQLQAGGTYLIAVSSNGGPADMRIRGAYLDVVPPGLLSYTWNVEALGERETFVVARFFDNGAGSRLSLSHGLFKDDRETELHADGWRAVLARLQNLLSS